MLTPELLDKSGIEHKCRASQLVILSKPLRENARRTLPPLMELVLESKLQRKASQPVTVLNTPQVSAKKIPLLLTVLVQESR